MALKPVDEALAEILSYFEPLPPEPVGLFQARGRVLAEDIIADFDVPPFRNSAMDGYAVRAVDTAEASGETPVILRVVADVAAGDVAETPVPPGGAVRIMTGAPLPPGADAVVRFEETSEALPEQQQPGPGRVAVLAAADLGQNVREPGEDLRAGAVVIPRGRPLRPAEIGVLAALGRATVPVVRRPRIAILATGDELVAIDEPLAPGKIRNSNEYTTAALVEQAGGIPIPLGIARDSVAHLTAKVQEGLARDVDLFLTSAGVSVGDYDIVKHVLAAEGEMHFWQVAIKPGRESNSRLEAVPEGIYILSRFALDSPARSSRSGEELRADYARRVSLPGSDLRRIASLLSRRSDSGTQAMLERTGS